MCLCVSPKSLFFQWSASDLTKISLNLEPRGGKMLFWSVQISSEPGPLWHAYPRCLWLWLNSCLLLAEPSNINQGSGVGSSCLFSEHMPGAEHPVTLSIPLKPLSLKYFHPEPFLSRLFSLSSSCLPCYPPLCCPLPQEVIYVFKFFDVHLCCYISPPQGGQS